MASLREERAMFEGEVARLRLELEMRDAEREEKLANADANDADANAENAENKASSSLDAEERDYYMQDMLAMEVQRLLAKQAELSNHLARAQREKEMLEKENELLYQQTEAVEEDAQTARFERALAWERLSEAESAAGFRVLETAIAPSSPPRDQDVVSPSVSSRASPIKAGGPPIKGSALPKMEKASDGPDAELAAKLIGRLERGGESDEAASLKLEMERMKAELGRMKAERAESLGRSRVGSDAASETKPIEEDERRRSGEDTGDSASAAAPPRCAPRSRRRRRSSGSRGVASSRRSRLLPSAPPPRRPRARRRRRCGSSRRRSCAPRTPSARWKRCASRRRRVSARSLWRRMSCAASARGRARGR